MASQPASVRAAHLILTSRNKEAWELVQKEECWNSLLAAAAPSQGYEAWANSMRSRASRLAAGEHVHWAVCHLLSSGDIWQAVQLYMRHGMQREALALARCRLHVRDPAFGSLLGQLLQLLPASLLPERPQRMLAQQTRQEGQQHLERKAEFQQLGEEQLKQLPEHKWALCGSALTGKSHIPSTEPNYPGKVLRSPQEAHITSATILQTGVVAAPPGPAVTGASGPCIAASTETAASVSIPMPPANNVLPKETGAVARPPTAAAAAVVMGVALTKHVAPEAAAANAAAASSRLVPPEVLALQGLLAGRPLLAARALRAAGTTSALATTAQLCAQVVRGKNTGGGWSSMRQELEEDDSHQTMEDLGRACAADAMLAVYRESQHSLAALASSGAGGGISNQSLTAVQADVQAACKKAQAASAIWGGAALAGSHCAVQLLAWCVGRLQQLGPPESYASCEGDGGGGADSIGSSTGSRSFGDAARKGSKETVAVGSDANVIAALGDNEAVQRSTGEKVGGTNHGGVQFNGLKEEKIDYDDDDEMALLAVHATYLGRGPFASRGGAARRRVVAIRQVQQTGTATVVAAVPEVPAPQSADLALQAQLGLGEGGHGTAGAVLTAAAAAAAASAMWVAACAACNVKGDDPAVACAAQAALHAATTVATDTLPVAVAAALDVRAQSMMAEQAIGLVPHGEVYLSRPCSENVQCSQNESYDAEDSSREVRTVAVHAVEAQQVGGPADWTAGGQLQPLQPQQLEPDQARSGPNGGAAGCCCPAGVGADVDAKDHLEHPQHEDTRQKPSKCSGRSGGCSSGGGDIAKQTAAKEAMAEMQLAIYSLAAAAMRAGTSNSIVHEESAGVAISTYNDTLEQAAQAVIVAARKCAALLPPPMQPPSLQPPLVTAAKVRTSIAASTGHLPNHHRIMQRLESSASPLSTSGDRPTRKIPCTRGRSRELATTATSGGDAAAPDRRVAGALEPSSPLYVLFLLQQQDEEARQRLHYDQLEKGQQQQQQFGPVSLGEGIVEQQFRDQEAVGEQNVSDVAAVVAAFRSGEGGVVDSITVSTDSRIRSSRGRATAAAADLTLGPSNVSAGGGLVRMRYSRSEMLWVRRQVLVMEPERGIGLREEVLERLRFTGLIAASFQG